jgi:ribA/ribD-fused uncharacterized protein
MERITDKYVFFWGSEFSNWFACKFRYKSITFFNSEQAFMWEKAVFFGDMESAEKILKTPSPSECKALGKKVKNFDAAIWLTEGYKVMFSVNLAKFNQNHRLKDTLISTGNKIIVEASPYDVIWGIGLGSEDDRCLDETQWRGQNLLGKVLMDVRKRLILFDESQFIMSITQTSTERDAGKIKIIKAQYTKDEDDE